MLMKVSELFIKSVFSSVGFLGIYIMLVVMISEHLESVSYKLF